MLLPQLKKKKKEYGGTQNNSYIKNAFYVRLADS
jgi:hypothetical protein